MDEEKSGGGLGYQFMIGWNVKCHQCGDALPLLHPHIVAERYDEHENMICEQCYERLCSET